MRDEINMVRRVSVGNSPQNIITPPVINTNEAKYMCNKTDTKSDNFNNSCKNLIQHGLMEKEICKRRVLKVGKRKQQKSDFKERNLICDFCKKTYAKKCILESHVLLHLGVKPFHCTFCPKNFTQRCTLMEHIRIHTKEKPYKCEICSRTFRVYSSWHKHIKRHQEPTIKCEACDSKFRSNNELKSHMNCRHNDSRPFKCTQCPAAFKVEVALRGHVKSIHEAVKDSEMCESCGKKFKTKTHLKVHIKHFHAEPKIPCSHCTKLFKTKNMLKRHKDNFIRHALVNKFEERSKLYPFPCVYCDDIFENDEERKKHSNLIHSKSFPIFCKICPYRFKKNIDFKKHLIKFHSPSVELDPKKFYPCPNCGKVLKNKYILIRHLETRECKNKKCSKFKSDLNTLVQVFDTDCEFVDVSGVKDLNI